MTLAKALTCGVTEWPRYIPWPLLQGGGQLTGEKHPVPQNNIKHRRNRCINFVMNTSNVAQGKLCQLCTDFFKLLLYCFHVHTKLFIKKYL